MDHGVALKKVKHDLAEKLVGGQNTLLAEYAGLRQ